MKDAAFILQEFLQKEYLHQGFKWNYLSAKELLVVVVVKRQLGNANQKL